MKKISIFLALVLLAIASVALLVWTNRENVFAHFLSRELHVPVSLHSLDLNRHAVILDRLWIGTPPHSRSTTSFSAETASIDTSLDTFFNNPLVIETIEIDHIFVGIEFYDQKGTTSNWTVILKEDKTSSNARDYLIKTLMLRDLTVEVTQMDGTIKRYPTIPQMEFHNISRDTGFPIDEIEKAIFNLMMKNLFQTLPIESLFKTIVPSWILP